MPEQHGGRSMRIFCLDDDTSLASVTGAIFCEDSLERVQACQAGANDVVLVNMDAADSQQRGERDDPPWTSKWTRLTADVRNFFPGWIVVAHTLQPEEAARRLYAALGGPGLGPVDVDFACDSDELIRAWKSAGIVFLQDPPVDGIDDIIPHDPPPQVEELRFRLRLVHALQAMRGQWHKQANSRAALRILGGAVMSWVADATDPTIPDANREPRGLPPSTAIRALQNWRDDLQHVVWPDDPQTLEDLREKTLPALITTLQQLGLNQRIKRAETRWPATASSNRPQRRAVLIDDEAHAVGWTRILRAILETRFDVALHDSDVETNSTKASERLSDTSAHWLDDKHLILLDIAFPNQPTGGMRLLDQITTSRPTPIVMFSALTSGALVRRSLEHGATFFFKEYEDDSNTIDYYRYFERVVAAALARTPRLVVDRRWEEAVYASKKNGDRFVDAGTPWIRQAIELMDMESDRFRPPSVGAGYLAVVSAGVAAEELLDAAWVAFEQERGGFPASHPDTTMRIVVRSNLATPVPGPLGPSGPPEFILLEHKLVGPDRVRLQCGWLVRAMRNAVVHGDFQPKDVTELDAVIVLLALSHFVSGNTTDNANRRRMYGPLQQWLKAQGDIQQLPPLGSNGDINLLSLRAICDHLIQERRRETGRHLRSVESVVNHAMKSGADEISHIVRAGFYAVVLDAVANLPRLTSRHEYRIHANKYGKVDPDTEMLTDLCRHRIGQLVPGIALLMGS